MLRTKIRKKIPFLKGKSVSKYLLYGLGEVLLVMIGILLALQVNNWNEDRKGRDFEIKMLTEVGNALESDVEYFERIKKRMENLQKSVAFYTDLVYQQSIYPNSNFLDSTAIDKFNSLRTGINYIYNRGPYEAIKFSGIDKISNDSVRNALIKFYDFDLPRHMELTTWYNRRYESDLDRLNSFETESIIVKVGDTYDFKSSIQEDILKQQAFLKLLENMKMRSRITISYLEGILPEMVEMVNLMQAEIEGKVL